MRNKVRPRCSENSMWEKKMQAWVISEVQEDSGVGCMELLSAFQLLSSLYTPLLWTIPVVASLSIYDGIQLCIVLEVVSCYCLKIPWSGFLKTWIQANIWSVNENESCFLLSLCCIIGQIRNAIRLEFELATWSRMLEW